MQINRALPNHLRVTDTSFASLRRALNAAQDQVIVTDTSLVQINRAVEAIR